MKIHGLLNVTTLCLVPSGFITKLLSQVREKSENFTKSTKQRQRNIDIEGEEFHLENLIRGTRASAVGFVC